MKSYREAAPLVAECLGLNADASEQVATLLVAHGVLPKSSGRRIETPDFYGLVSLALGLIASDLGFRKAAVVSFVLRANREDLGSLSSRVHGAAITTRSGDATIVVRLPRGTEDALESLARKGEFNVAA